MREQITLADGRRILLEDETLSPFRARLAQLPPAAPVRLAFAAPHVVLRDSYRAVGHAPAAPGAPREIAAHVDWEATLALRVRLIGLGFGIAEAMDTAQRFALGWDAAARLIEQCGRLRPAHGFLAGAATDHLGAIRSREELIEGVVYQARFIQQAGGMPMLLPMPWLTRTGASQRDFIAIYGAIFERLDGPLFLHWLGEQFLPELRGYFPGASFSRILDLDPAKVRGAKLSLLDPEREVRLRRELLARDQILLTGDDLHFAPLIRGGDPVPGAAVAAILRYTDLGGRAVPLGDFSHALLGIFDAVAEPAALALRLLAAGDMHSCEELLLRCQELGRWVFQAPTRYYKSGLAFLAWLNGLQDNRLLVNHEETARDLDYYTGAAELAARAGAISNATLAATRLRSLLASG